MWGVDVNSCFYDLILPVSVHTSPNAPVCFTLSSLGRNISQYFTIIKPGIHLRFKMLRSVCISISELTLAVFTSTALPERFSSNPSFSIIRSSLDVVPSRACSRWRTCLASLLMVRKWIQTCYLSHLQHKLDCLGKKFSDEFTKHN